MREDLKKKTAFDRWRERSERLRDLEIKQFAEAARIAADEELARKYVDLVVWSGMEWNGVECDAM